MVNAFVIPHIDPISTLYRPHLHHCPRTVHVVRFAVESLLCFHRTFILVSCFLFLPFIHNEVGVHSLDPESVGMITRLEGLSDYFTH